MNKTTATSGANNALTGQCEVKHKGHVAFLFLVVG